MKRTWIPSLLLIFCGVLISNPAFSDEPTPGFNNPIPSSILTPDVVETSIGTLNFFDGMPEQETVRKVYDNLDRIRATEVFLDMVPLASIEGMRRGFESAGVDSSHKILLYNDLMDSNSLF